MSIENILPAAELSNDDIIIITSRNALRALSQLDNYKNYELIVLGKSTCLLAQQEGFNSCKYAGKNLKELCAYIKSHYKDRNLVYLSGEIVTEELNYKNCNAYINRIIVYKTTRVDSLSINFKENILKNNFNGVIFFSKESARIFCELLEKEGLQPYLGNLYAFCLSPEISKSISSYGFKATMYAKNPYMNAIIKMIVNFRF